MFLSQSFPEVISMIRTDKILEAIEEGCQTWRVPGFHLVRYWWILEVRVCGTPPSSYCRGPSATNYGTLGPNYKHCGPDKLKSISILRTPGRCHGGEVQQWTGSLQPPMKTPIKKWGKAKFFRVGPFWSVSFLIFVAAGDTFGSKKASINNWWHCTPMNAHT